MARALLALVKLPTGVTVTNLKVSDEPPRDCAVEVTVAMIGGKWKPIILFHLSEARVLRFGELARKVPQVSDRVLTRQLRELEQDDLVERVVFAQVPPRVEYNLTDGGRSLIPVLLAMSAWGHGRQSPSRSAANVSDRL